MNSALAGLRSPAPAVRPTASPVAPIDTGMAKTTRGLIWLYLFLWVVEGALRKWFLVSLSDVLLIVRDPIVLAIYATALIGGLFPLNAFFFATLILAALSGMAGFVVIPDLPAVVAFGLRSNFLHLPLIFVMGKVLRPKDLKWMALFFMAGAIPQAMLMAKQYRSGIDSWWNLGAGGGRQIEAARDLVRPAGTFSFITGPVFYFSITTAFVLGSLVMRKWARWWLLIPVLGSTFLAAAVSGSRSLLISCILVGLMFFIGCAAYPRALKSLAKLFLVGLVGFAFVAGLNVYQAGRETTTTRATSATENEGGVAGVVNRVLDPVRKALLSVGTVDFLGSGLGLGTNGGAALSGSRGKFLVGEDEWTRTVGESGPFLGLSFMALRVALGVWAFAKSLGAARRGNLLPLALLGAAGPGLVLGQFGQPTSLGATVFSMGLWLASLALPFEDTLFVEQQSAVTTALNSAKTPLSASLPLPLPVAPALPGRQTPFNVARPGTRFTEPPPAPAPEPEPEPLPALEKPAYKPGRFAVRGSSPAPPKE